MVLLVYPRPGRKHVIEHLAFGVTEAREKLDDIWYRRADSATSYETKKCVSSEHDSRLSQPRPQPKPRHRGEVGSVYLSVTASLIRKRDDIAIILQLGLMSVGHVRLDERRHARTVLDKEEKLNAAQRHSISYSGRLPCTVRSFDEACRSVPVVKGLPYPSGL